MKLIFAIALCLAALALVFTDSLNAQDLPLNNFLLDWKGKSIYAIYDEGVDMSFAQAQSICQTTYQGEMVKTNFELGNDGLYPALASPLWKKYDESKISGLFMAIDDPRFHTCGRITLGGMGGGLVPLTDCNETFSSTIGICSTNLRPEGCGWPKKAFGGPEPVVSIAIKNDGMEVTVVMRNHPSQNVAHAINFDPLTQEAISNGTYQNYANANTITNTTACETTYKFTLPWNSDHLEKSSFSEELQIYIKLYTYYIIGSPSSARYIEHVFNPYVAASRRSDTITLIEAEASQTAPAPTLPMEISLTSISKVPAYYTQFSLQMTAELLSDYDITSIYQIRDYNSDLIDIRSITFSIVSVENNRRKYRVSMTTDEDYGSNPRIYQGLYTVGVIVAPGSGSSFEYTELSFEMFYQTSPSDYLNAGQVLSAQADVKDAIHGNAKTTFTSGETAFVHMTYNYSSLVSTAANNDADITAAYVCCADENVPDALQTLLEKGCTTYDSDRMTKWYKLMSDGAINGLLSPATHESSSNPNESILSFKIDGVSDEDRQCVVHVTSILKQ